MKVLKWLLALIITIPLVIVVGAYVGNKAIGPKGWAEDNTIKALKGKMKDPESMAIRSSYFVIRDKGDDSTEINMCGVVDGKNSFGGYTGGTRFASRSVSSKRFNTFDTYSVQLEDPTVRTQASRVKMLSPFAKVYWNEWCVDATHPALTPSD